MAGGACEPYHKKSFKVTFPHIASELGRPVGWVGAAGPLGESGRWHAEAAVPLGPRHKPSFALFPKSLGEVTSRGGRKDSPGHVLQTLGTCWGGSHCYQIAQGVQEVAWGKQ